MIPVMLSLTALIAYFFGSISSGNFTSHLYFKCNLAKKYPRDNEGITRFWLDQGFKGTAVLFGTEIVKTLIPVLLGGLLMNLTGHADVGFAFAMFAAALGEVFPIMYEFEGETCLIAVTVSLLLVRPGVAIFALLAFLTVYLIWNYVSLSALAGAVTMWFVSLLTIDTPIVRRLVLLTALLIVIQNRRGLIALLRGKGEKFVLRKDLSYVFDKNMFDADEEPDGRKKKKDTKRRPGMR